MNRPRASNEARSDVFWSAAFFVALQVVVAIAGLYWVRELHDPRYEYKAAVLHRRVAAAERPLTTVMLGSSRTVFALRGTILENRLSQELERPAVAFNFGAYGAGPVTQLITLRRLLADGVRPDLLLIEVTPLYFAGQPSAIRELASLSPTRLWLDEFPLLEQYGSENDVDRTAWWLANVCPCYGYRFNIVSRLAPKLLPSQLQQNISLGMDESGWAPLPARQSAYETRAALTAAAQRTMAANFEQFQLGGASVQALSDLLAHCRNEGLEVALVFMPESSEYRNFYPPEAQLQIQEFVERISREFAAPVIDARTWVPDREFADGHHMLPEGATVFTSRLCDEVTSLLKVITARRVTAATTAQCR